MTTIRFTPLTSRVIRLEYSPNGRFEDRRSQAFWFRDQPTPPHTITPAGDGLILETEHLRLEYRPQAGDEGFTPTNLTITSNDFAWQYGQTDKENLLGTYRTLDNASGRVPLEQGLLSRAGWVLVDDSASLVFNDDGWLEPRPEGAVDLYFFGHGRDYASALADYTALTGPVPLLPRWALGNWWSRYHTYTQAELTNLMLQFRQRNIPLAVCIVDMDWHITDTGGIHNGWTGYTWNRHLFPDPAGFMRWLHQQGLRTALNLHPADGVGAHEEAYAAVATRMGVDPSTQQTIPFDIANPTFAKAYLEELHHPHEANGVDFWWMDWQQGHTTSLKGLDPLWWLNHLHFNDLGREGTGKRPFIFSRWGGLGNHRTPIGFSGDTHVDWPSLQFQPYFTSTAANVRYGWWSHDIGGHMGGIEEPELYTRWVQYGVFSPIFRLHSTNNPHNDRRPWAWDAETEKLSAQAMRLRHALIPYIYSMAWRDHAHGEALIRPLYHLHPERDEAYVCPQAYTFGSELIAAPYTTPADPETRLSKQVVWLPEGDWRDFFTGQAYVGGRFHSIFGGLGHTPVFAKAGGIIPLAAEQAWSDTSNPAVLDVHLVAGADGRFELYEDDGVSNGFTEGQYSLTAITQQWRADGLLTAVIHPATGTADHLPAQRTWRLHLHGLAEPTAVQMTLNSQLVPSTWAYDEALERVVLEGVTAAPDTAIQVVVQAQISRRPRLRENVLAMLAAFRMESWAKLVLQRRVDELLADPHAILTHFGHALNESQKRALYERVLEAGSYHIDYLPEEEVVVLWNHQPERTPAPRYRLQTHTEAFWVEERFGGEQGVVPPFKALHLPRQVVGRRPRPYPLVWHFALAYE